IYLSGCASSKSLDAARQMQPINPHAALEYVALCLQDDPDDDDARELLDSIIPAIVYEHENRVTSMIQAGAYEDAIVECDRVIASSYLVRTMPGGPYNLYYQENQRAELTGLAAGKAYKEARKFEVADDFRSAVDGYDRALGFVENYKDAAIRREKILDSVISRLYITCDDPDRDPRAARIITRGIGSTVMSQRPRFLKLARDRDSATSICTVMIEDANFRDSGWISNHDSKKVEVDVYNKKGEKTGTVEKRAYWTVYRRETAFTLLAGFTVRSENSDEPVPSGRASKTASSEVSYARWHGEKSGVPSDVLDMPGSPGSPKSRKTLTAECASAVVRELGHKLFLGYK
ncbi:MAG: hypothetical protein U9N73_04545, partial [Candidatus Auribacterota bacterium]|nr:hypothetical protein [Candidatus Auribacterota bacterium]